MAFDFNYENTTIQSGGGFKPSKKNAPIDVRTVVDSYSDIASIPNPYIGLTVTVKSDETNEGKMTDYKVISLKANGLGVPNMLVNEVKRMNEYLEVSSSGNSSGDLSDYVTKTELNTSLSTKVDKVSGYSLVSDTEIARLANVDNYDDSEIRGLIPTKVSQLLNDRNYLNSIPSEYITETELNDKGYATIAEVDQKIAGIGTSGTVNLNEYQKITDDTLSTSNKTITGAINEVNSNLVASLNGKKISDPMTKAEYDALTNKDPDMIYLVDDESIIGLPDYSSSDANKVLAVNSNGTALAWVDGTEGNGLTAEQSQQLQTAYEHSQSAHVTMDEVNAAIDTKMSELGTILDSINGEVI